MSDPLHTRALSVILTAAPEGRLAARASLLDVRKVGIVPVGGDLGTPGVVHHMWLDACLMLAPTFIQVCGAMSEGWPARAAAADSVIGMGGLPDSCYMWRRDGALDRRRSPNDPVPTLGG